MDPTVGTRVAEMIAPKVGARFPVCPISSWAICLIIWVLIRIFSSEPRFVVDNFFERCPKCGSYNKKKLPSVFFLSLLGTIVNYDFCVRGVRAVS